jgi:hypothetical protein
VSVSVLTSIANLLPQLHATDSSLSGDLVWWSKKELIRFFDEALKSFAKRFPVFIRRDTSMTLVAGTAAYTAPSRHIATLYAAHNNKPLAPATTLELECLDTNYLTTAGTPLKFYEDKGGVNKIALHPVPTSGDVGVSALEIIQAEYPADVDENEVNTTMPVPLVIADYLEFCALRDAYHKESDGALPEVAGQLAEVAKMFEKAAGGYWGTI